ncbi:unnamed protein product [Calypogeia fissa]
MSSLPIRTVALGCHSLVDSTMSSDGDETAMKGLLKRSQERLQSMTVVTAKHNRSLGLRLQSPDNGSSVSARALDRECLQRLEGLTKKVNTYSFTGYLDWCRSSVWNVRCIRLRDVLDRRYRPHPSGKALVSGDSVTFSTYFGCDLICRSGKSSLSLFGVQNTRGQLRIAANPESTTVSKKKASQKTEAIDSNSPVSS